jgi:hypothetical protein
MASADATNTLIDRGARLARNFAEYEHYLARARAYLNQKEMAASAVHCAIAAHIAVQNHCGVFWSPRLESILGEIGRRVGASAPHRKRPTEIKRVLQVGTQMRTVGGLTKMLGLWVKADSKRQHSLVLTQHRGPTPASIRDAFAAAGGRVEHLCHRPGGPIEWALRLREIARDYDAVILHTHCEDIIPIIAFANPAEHPPVIILNHADHLFWFGPSVCHLAINLRDAAQDLAVARRGIAPERNTLVPTLSESITRKRTRAEAKRELGVAPDSVLLVSAARQLKYKTMDGLTFADIHAPILEKHPAAHLWVVGAGEAPDWAPVRARFGNRVRSLPEQPDPRIFFEAADIYVDSYPFVSSTSLMEAAGYGAPSITIFMSPPEARIFGINHVALVGTVLQAGSFDEYRAMLDRLITDPALRDRTGETARVAVAQEHNMPGWLSWLEAAYAKALALPSLDNRSMLLGAETPHFGEPDIRHEDMFGGNWPTIERVKSYMAMLPPHQHWAHWNEVRRAGAFPNALSAASALAPEWMKRLVKDGLLNPTD